MPEIHDEGTFTQVIQFEVDPGRSAACREAGSPSWAISVHPSGDCTECRADLLIVDRLVGKAHQGNGERCS